MSTHSIRRFFKYAVVNVGTLLLDLAMLYIAVSVVHIPLAVSTPGSFLIAVSIDYLLSRQYVFIGTKRSWHAGYLYFIIFAILTATVTTVLTLLLVNGFHLWYLLARILVAGLIGLANYVFNLYVNFKVVGMHD